MAAFSYQRPKLTRHVALLGLGLLFVAIGHFDRWNGELVFDLPPRWFQFFYLHRESFLLCGFAVCILQLLRIASSLLKVFQGVPISRLLLPSQIVNDSIAAKTSWLRFNGTDLPATRPLRLRRGGNKLCFKTAVTNLVSPSLLMALGMIILSFSLLPPTWTEILLPDHNPSWLLLPQTIQESLSLTHLEISTKQAETLIIVLVGCLVLLSGTISWLFSSRPIEFDKALGYFWLGRVRVLTPVALSMDKSAHRIDQIYAIQVIDGESAKTMAVLMPERESTDNPDRNTNQWPLNNDLNGQIDNANYDSESGVYELNIIMEDGERFHLNTYTEKDSLADDASQLADFLGLPVWQGLRDN